MNRQQGAKATTVPPGIGRAGGVRGLRTLAAIGLMLVLAACGTTPSYRGSAPMGPAGEAKVGKPYKVAGRWYHPRFDPYYDRTGIASWYGRKFHGRRTANGERFNMRALTAAHPTLPLPSYVRVTNLENGRWVILRVNDRGPFVRGRIIDVSYEAARLLGFVKQGTARVRVQVVGPDGRPRARPVRRVAARPAPARVAVKAPPAPRYGIERKALASTRLFVQAGAFLIRRNALEVAAQLNGIGPTRISSTMADGLPLYRVRIGPLASVEQADRVLEGVLSRGHTAAKIVVE